MASVRKRDPKDPNSPWVCEYTDAKGKRRRYTPQTGLKKDADAFRRKVEGELERGEHVARSQTDTIGVAGEAWLRDCEKRARVGDRMTKSTVAMYTSCFKRLGPIGGKLLTDITRDDLQSFVDDLGEDLSGVTVRHTVMALGLIYDYAIAAREAKRNLVRDYKSTTRLPAKANRVIVPSQAELQALLRAARERAPGERPLAAQVRHAMVAIGMFGGLRRGEMCGLKWDCVDLDRSVIRVRRSLSRLDGLKEPKTTSGVRDVPIVPQVAAALRAIPSNREPEEYVLTVTGGGGPISPNDMSNLYWRAICAKAGLADEKGRPKYKLHSLRHAAASLFIASGLSPLHVKTVIGHASVQTTLNIYGHLFPEDEAIRVAATGIAARFDATVQPL
ncbi:tyrosine-type recombinase/integrase [Chelatococcus reniformis]|uniref:Site-specific integrase n=1 Tax=Chelatococcus reniformis TaxID=1494448 RepID=A0A916XR91_9HYPH|nr:site-specific integrase [Chelatococcus reniformis]GGC94661.1 site-specific integrase [Chelatococcus reniformis]